MSENCLYINCKEGGRKEKRQKKKKMIMTRKKNTLSDVMRRVLSEF